MKIEIYLRNPKSKKKFYIKNPQASADVRPWIAGDLRRRILDETSGVKGVKEVNPVYEGSELEKEIIGKREVIGLEVCGQFNPYEVFSMITNDKIASKCNITGMRVKC